MPLADFSMRGLAADSDVRPFGSAIKKGTEQNSVPLV